MLGLQVYTATLGVAHLAPASSINIQVPLLHSHLVPPAPSCPSSLVLYLVCQLSSFSHHRPSHVDLTGTLILAQSCPLPLLSPKHTSAHSCCLWESPAACVTFGFLHRITGPQLLCGGLGGWRLPCARHTWVAAFRGRNYESLACIQ